MKKHLDSKTIIKINENIKPEQGFVVLQPANIDFAIINSQRKKSLPDQAGELMSRIVESHPFLNGNKRTALGSALVFLEKNSCKVKPLPVKDAYDFMVNAAKKHYAGKIYARWLRKHIICEK